MKTLYILRHGRAAHMGQDFDDFDRPLEEIGKKILSAFSNRLINNQFKPEIVLCSSARRTRETLDVFQPLLPDSVSIIYEESLYLASWQHILRTLHGLDNTFFTALLVGHNPGIEQFIQWAIGDSAMDTVKPFPMGGFCFLEFPVTSWQDIAQVSGHLKQFLKPEELV